MLGLGLWFIVQTHLGASITFTFTPIRKYFRFHAKDLELHLRKMDTSRSRDELMQQWQSEGLTEVEIEERFFQLEEARKEKEEKEFLKGVTQKESDKRGKKRAPEDEEDDEFGELIEAEAAEEEESGDESDTKAKKKKKKKDKEKKKDKKKKKKKHESEEEEETKEDRKKRKREEKGEKKKKKKDKEKKKKKKHEESEEEDEEHEKESRRRKKKEDKKKKKKEEKEERKKKKKKHEESEEEEEDVEEGEEEDNEDHDDDDDDEDEPVVKKQKKMEHAQPNASADSGLITQDDDGEQYRPSSPVRTYEEEKEDIVEEGDDKADSAFELEPKEEDDFKEQDELQGGVGESVDLRPATRENLGKIQLTRKLAEKWLVEPFFKTTIIGCPVRISVGEDPNGNPAYKMCQVVDVNTKPNQKYKFGAAFTQDYLVVAIGDSKKEFPFNYLSNGVFTEAEYRKWIEGLAAHGKKPITKELYRKKKECFEETHNYKYSEEDINRMVKERQRLQPDAFLNLPQERSLLRSRLDVLRFGGQQDTTEFRELEAKLQKLLAVEMKRLDIKSDPWMKCVEHTMRNRGANTEKQYQRILRPDEARKQESAKATKQAGGNDVVDVYARIPTRPSIYWYTGGKAVEDKSEAQGEQERKSTEQARAARLQVHSSPTFYALLAHSPMKLLGS